MASIFTEANVRNDHKLGTPVFDGPDGLLDDSGTGIGFGAPGIFLFGYTEEDDCWNTQVESLFRFLDSQVHGQLGDPGHGANLVSGFPAMNNEERVDEIIPG
jgi:hypothetical protein